MLTYAALQALLEAAVEESKSMQTRMHDQEMGRYSVYLLY
jgi:hypothetical protein